jgi:hypothetical protein
MTSGFSTSTFWGIAGLDGTVRWARWPSVDLETIAVLRNAVFASAARSDVFVWAVSDSGEATDGIWAFWPEGGKTERLWHDAGWSTKSVALTETHVLWVEGSGPLTESGLSTALRFRWAPFAPPATGIGPTYELAIPATWTASHLAAGGRTAATHTCLIDDDTTTEDPCWISVADLGAPRVRMVPYRRAARFVEVLTATDEELLLSEVTVDGGPPRTDFERLVWLETSSLDAYEDGWP